ncbi:hypothetical protein ACE1ET_12200 [Saccharicrinis sp. FJH62]|uniref:hypothetical protein n=1 Tax=Saccharicrinis sp. FJH62 TaxID=3344657 RepID=UPI0035D416A1
MKNLLLIVFLSLIVFSISCEKKADEHKIGDELLVKLDEDGNEEYYIEACDEMNIDTTFIEGDVSIYITFSGCDKSFKYFVKADWYYNCYPVYDYWGYYLYDDCYWEYEAKFDIDKDSLIVN